MLIMFEEQINAYLLLQETSTFFFWKKETPTFEMNRIYEINLRNWMIRKERKQQNIKTNLNHKLQNIW